MIKRGQVTIFIIIVILLIAALTFVLFIRSALVENIKTDIEEKQVLPAELQILDTTLSNCVDEVSSNGLQLIGLKGGYIIVPPESLQTETFSIPYYKYNNQDLTPSLEDIKERLEAFINAKIPECFDIIKFEEQGFNIITEDPKTNVEFNDNVVITSKYPLEVNFGESVYTLDKEYTVFYDVRFTRIYEAAKEITRRSMQEEYAIDIGYIIEQEDLNMTLSFYQDEALVYDITDPSSIINNQTYTYLFAHKFE